MVFDLMQGGSQWAMGGSHPPQPGGFGAMVDDPGGDCVDAEPLVGVAASDGSVPDGCSPGAVYK